MGIQNQNHHHQQFYYKRNTFLPMLCSRPSIKEVIHPRFIASSGNDPLSPRISCMGQVKKKNKIASIAPKTNTNSSPCGKYSKLKKLFSGKNFMISTPTSTTSTSDVPKSQRCLKSENNVVCISIENMDPPLPVLKRLPKLEEGIELVSLWKRRSARPALKKLQIHHSRICDHPPTV